MYPGNNVLVNEGWQQHQNEDVGIKPSRRMDRGPADEILFIMQVVSFVYEVRALGQKEAHKEDLPRG